MSLKCSWVSEIMNGHAPLSLALEYDNVGWILGGGENPLYKVLVALDLTDQVADEAVAGGFSMVLTHHPMIFRPIKKITEDNPLGRKIIKLLRNNISVYAAHTNLDICRGGTNDTLAEIIGLEVSGTLDVPDENGNALGRVGELPGEITLEGLAAVLKERLNLPAIGVTGVLSRSVRRVGLCTGSGSDPKYITMAKAKGCDVYITGDITYHNAQAAAELDIALIDATHYGTEVIIVKALKKLLECHAARAGADIEIVESAVDTRTLDYL